MKNFGSKVKLTFMRVMTTLFGSLFPKGTNAMMLKDFYKAVHSEMLPEGMTKSVSYFTPRRSRIDQWDHVVNYGLQAFCKTWLIDYFNYNFFYRSTRSVVKEYKKYMENTMGVGICDFDKIKKLHKLGYLPIEIVSLPEGAEVPMHCPIFGITNTHPDFAWLGQALESLISAEMWYPMVCATVGHSYRKIVDKYYNETCDDNIPHRRALGNFDFRGDQGVEAALKAAGGWLLSFVNTATVPSIPYMEKMYNCDCRKDEVGFGAVSTEHFVMCSASAYDIKKNPTSTYRYADEDPMRELVLIKRLLTQVYPNTSFSCVMDSYDFYRTVKNLAFIKKEILKHNGCMLIRGDSGDPVQIILDTVDMLWDLDLPENHINSKGYKVLDPHVKALYGDSITLPRAETIFAKLKEKGYAASNVSLGVGSFSMHCIEEDGMLKPFTRDTFSFAIKAIYAEFTDENGEVTKMLIHKDPKTDRDTGFGFKKSQKGCCCVQMGPEDYEFDDGLTWEEAYTDYNELKPIFKEGKLLKEESLNDIRQRLNKGNF